MAKPKVGHPPVSRFRPGTGSTRGAAAPTRTTLPGGSTIEMRGRPKPPLPPPEEAEVEAEVVTSDVDAANLAADFATASDSDAGAETAPVPAAAPAAEQPAPRRRGRPPGSTNTARRASKPAAPPNGQNRQQIGIVLTVSVGDDEPHNFSTTLSAAPEDTSATVEDGLNFISSQVNRALGLTK